MLYIFEDDSKRYLSKRYLLHRSVLKLFSPVNMTSQSSEIDRIIDDISETEQDSEIGGESGWELECDILSYSGIQL